MRLSSVSYVTEIINCKKIAARLRSLLRSYLFALKAKVIKLLFCPMLLLNDPKITLEELIFNTDIIERK